MNDSMTNSFVDACVIGANSTIGSALIHQMVRRKKNVVGTSRRKHEVNGIFLDLSSDPSTWVLPDHCDVVYCCAAETSLHQCETNPYDTSIINIDKTRYLIDVFIQRKTFIVFFSTNLVFDGLQRFPTPTSPLCPNSEYGRQKASVETYLRQYYPEQSAILRLTKVVSPAMPLLKKWHHALLHHSCIDVYSNMFCAPIPLFSVVNIATLVGESRQSGIFHLSAEKDISYAELAYLYCDALQADNSLVHITACDISNNLRPANTALDTTATTLRLGITIPTVEYAVKSTLHSIPAQNFHQE